MPKINNRLENLNPYVKRVTTRILEHFPEWIHAIKTKLDEDTEINTLNIEIDSPSKHISLWVLIEDTDIEEQTTTIGIHSHHSHFYEYYADSTEEHLNNIIKYINPILTEEYTVYSLYCGEQFHCSYTDVPNAIVSSTKIKGITKATCRSWMGTYDSDDVTIE